MALVGSKVEVAQQGDGSTIGVRTDVVFDQHTGPMVKKRQIRRHDLDSDGVKILWLELKPNKRTDGPGAVEHQISSR